MASDKPPEKPAERIIFDGNFVQVGHRCEKKWEVTKIDIFFVFFPPSFCLDPSTAEAVLMCCEFNPNASLVAAGLSNGSIKVSCNLVTMVTVLTFR